ILEQRLRASLSKGRVVDFTIHFDDGDVFSEVGFETVKERPVGLEVVERFSGGADHADGPARDKYGEGAAGGVEFFSQDGSQAGTLLRRRSHEGYLGIVTIEISPLE